MNLATDIDLPPAFADALMYYILAAKMSPILSSLDANRQTVDNNYRQLFENECNRLSGLGIDVDESRTANNFNSKGFA